MPKLNRGGQRGTNSASFFSSASQSQTINTQSVNQNTLPPITNTVTMPTQDQVAKGDVTPGGGVPFAKFEKMTDDEKADVIEKALSTGVPIFLGDSSAQRLAYFTGMSNKPQVVTETQLNAMKGYDLWRSVQDSYDYSLDMNYSARDIANQILKADFTNYSGDGLAKGGSTFGKAIYMDTVRGSYGEGKGYGIIHAKLAPTAKVIDYSKLTTLTNNEIASGSKLGKAISKAEKVSRNTIYALAKGYDASRLGKDDYHMIYNRRAIVASVTIF